MRFYHHVHAFYCGVDLHARTLAVCVRDRDGHAVLQANIPASPDAFRIIVDDAASVVRRRTTLAASSTTPTHRFAVDGLLRLGSA